MRTASESEFTTASIMADLEQLYAAASYLNADRGKLDLVVNLLAAAVAELESMTEESPPVTLTLVSDPD